MGSEFNLNNDVAHLLRDWKKNSEELLTRFDENKDGQVGIEEWQKVRDAALKQVQSQHAEQKATHLYTCCPRPVTPEDLSCSRRYHSLIW